MATLLLRLAAPLQSWGTDSKFEIRNTSREPSKSGVIGILAAALGRKRDDSIDDLQQLRFGVRVDQEGDLVHDFHMVRKDKKTSYLTHRYYLSDAVFLVGLECENRDLLDTLSAALKHPVYPLFLGRRSCPPSQPLVLGIREEDLLVSLEKEPWLAAEWRQTSLKRKGEWLRIMMDADLNGVGSKVHDLPISFNPKNRQYGYRMASVGRVRIPDCPKIFTEHDAMKELR